MTRRALAVFVATVLMLSAGLAVTASSPAGAYTRIPAHNVTPPVITSASPCWNSPTSAACQTFLIAALNRGRTALGEPPYALPRTFTQLAPRDQLMVLSDLDRRLYGLQAIWGYNTSLVSSAAAGVRNGMDPAPVHLAKTHLLGYTANFFGYTHPMSALYAYFEWMYDDGPGGPNGECSSKNTTACWQHRKDTLFGTPGARQQLAFGDAYGSETNAPYSDWTEIYEFFNPSDPVPYLPTLTDLSAHSSAPGGAKVTISGFGFVGSLHVTVLGAAAKIVSQTTRSLVITTPPHAAGSGYIVVSIGTAKTSSTAVSAYSYTGP